MFNKVCKTKWHPFCAFQICYGLTAALIRHLTVPPSLKGKAIYSQKTIFAVLLPTKSPILQGTLYSIDFGRINRLEINAGLPARRRSAVGQEPSLILFAENDLCGLVFVGDLLDGIAESADDPCSVVGRDTGFGHSRTDILTIGSIAQLIDPY